LALNLNRQISSAIAAHPTQQFSNFPQDLFTLLFQQGSNPTLLQTFTSRISDNQWFPFFFFFFLIIFPISAD
jgi:hypothetical protein